ncbi:MAG: helix-turn-helix domain-containing protein [Terriglobia bacterium]
MSELRKLLKVEEFAAELNVRPSTVRRWVLLHKVLVIKISRAVRIPRTEVDRLISEGSRPACRVEDR